jgi:uncharacterized protein
VRILLPPSEAKRSGGAAAAHVLGDPDSPLARHRDELAEALVEFCGRDPVTAALALALPDRSADADLAANRALHQSPVRPALDRYAGTVYEGLDVASLRPAGRRRAMESVLIFSGLFGVLRADEPVPVYRLPVAASVPAVGPLTPYWRSALQSEMAELLAGELVVDLRSGDYGAMWKPAPALREQLVAVRIVSEQPGGRLAVISYPSKFGKGRLARALLERRGRLTSAAQVAQAWTDAGERDAIVRPDGGLDLLTNWVTPAAGRPTPKIIARARPDYTRPRP